MKYIKCKIDFGPRKDEIIWQVMDDNLNFIKFLNDDGTPATGFNEFTALTSSEEIPPDIVLNS